MTPQIRRTREFDYPHKHQLELTIAIREGEDGLVVAECLQLPGCMSQGATKEEALRNVADAAQACLSVMISRLIHESCDQPRNLVGIQSQETLRVKDPELEAVHA